MIDKLLRLTTSRPFNLVAFNLLWLGCVLGRQELIWLTAPLALGYSALLLNTGTVKPVQIAIPVVLGVAVDSAMTAAGLFVFSNNGLFIPAWLLVLWLAFATTLTLSLEIVGRRKLVAAVAGAVAVPFNYAVGARLEAVSFAEPVLAVYITMSVVWALLLPLLFAICEYFENEYSDNLQGESESETS